MQDSIQTVAGYVALAVPATVAITSIAKLAFEWLNQRHAINTARVDQIHQITTHYLNKALDPTVPLAIRHQLLRFPAIPDKNGSRLSDWARAELSRVEVIIDEANQSVTQAEKDVLSAKTAAELSTAERKLALAARKKQSLTEPPKAPPVSPAALKAGLIEEQNLGGLSMKNADLRGVQIAYKNLQASDFSGSSFAGGRLQGCDLRGVNFTKCDLSGVVLYQADLRGADLSGANCTKADFSKAHLESANLSDCNLNKADLRATYDSKTKWPKDFDPVAVGAVCVAE